jgi:hypothetical protein
MPLSLAAISAMLGSLAMPAWNQESLPIVGCESGVV